MLSEEAIIKWYSRKPGVPHKSCHLSMATSQTLTQNLSEVLSEHKLYQR